MPVRTEPIRVEAVLFDMDGVLINSAPVIEAAWRAVAACHGRHLSADDLRRHVHGRPGQSTVDALFADRSPRERARIWHGVDELEERAECEPLPGVLPLIRGLVAAGVPVALVTSSWPERIRNVCLMLGLDDTFATIVDRTTTERGKPHPDPYLAAARRLGCDPARVLAFEDSPSGVASALAAGACCVAVGTGAEHASTLGTITDFTGLRLAERDASTVLLGLDPDRAVVLGPGSDAERPVTPGPGPEADRAVTLAGGRPPPADELAARLVHFAVLLGDPAAASAGATFWELSVTHYRAVVAEATDWLRDRPDATAAYRHAVAQNADVAGYRRAIAALAAALRQDPAALQRLGRLVRNADETVLIDYHLGAAYRDDEPEVTYGMLLGAARPATRPVRRPRADVHVVIPFRDRQGTARLRNLLACLAALRDQAFPADRVTVTVVESDDEPRWRSVVEPLVEWYLYLPKRGLFNKSWTVNAGVVQAPVNPDVVCVLDADVLVDRDFLAVNTARLAAGEHRAHLNYRRMYCLDASSSNALIAARCLRREPRVSLAGARAHVLREPPGACLWATSEAFHAIGGFDERFEGWGGEDDDVVERLALLGPVARYDEPLLHLYHPRPQMRVAGKPFNAHLTPLTWNAGRPYGALTAPAEAGAAWQRPR